MGFVPIKLEDYVRKHIKGNRGDDAREVTARLREALAAYRAGAKCATCGQPIWVIGSAELGNTCFTCATLEADPSEDYEIAEACCKPEVPHPRPNTGDEDTDDRDVPF